MWVVDSLTPMNPRFLDCLPRHFSLFRLAVTAAVFWSGLVGPCVLAQIYQYRPYEISFTSTGGGYSNPFDPAIVTFSVAFAGPNSEHLDVIGFWDGGSTWKVRFAPPSPGSWSYVTTCSNTADTGLHNVTDSFSVCAATGSNPVYLHGGILRPSSNNRYLVYQDGTPFFYLADTWWSAPSYRMPYYSSQNSSIPTGKTFPWAVDQRVAQGFTVLQLHGSKGMHDDETSFDDSSKVFDKTDNVADPADPSYTDIEYWQLYDQYIAYAANSGLVINLGVAGTSLLDAPTLDELKRIFRYMQARYGAYPIIWLITQEYNSPTGSPSARKTKVYDLCSYLKSIDPYDRALGLHQYPVSPDHADDSWTEAWNDMIVDQNGHFHTPDAGDYLYNYFRPTPAPLLESELNYEGFENSTGTFVVDDTMVRQSAYTAIQSGSFGYGYGASGSYSGAANGSGQPANWGTIYDWWDGLAFDGAGQMQWLKNIYESVDWWTLEPTVGISENIRLFVKADAHRTVLVYFPSGISYTTGTILPDTAYGGASYSVTWFNPRDGSSMAGSPISVTTPGLALPARPDTNDWVLRLEYAGGGSVPPVNAAAVSAATSWDFDAGTDGWTVGNNISSLTGSEGALRGQMSGNDPQLISPDNVGTHLSANRYLKIRISNASSSVHGQISFTTTSNTAWPAHAQKQFLLKPKDSDFSDYIVDMWDVPDWTGTLKQLRIDPGDGVRSGVTIGYAFDIDYVRIGSAATTAPSAPVGLSGTDGYEQTTIAWSASAAADSYTLKRSAASGGPYSTVASGITSTHYVDTGLTGGVTYYYVVLAENAFGLSSSSSQVSAFAMAPPVPDAPDQLKLSIGDSSLTLEWQDSLFATGYSVKRGPSLGGSYSVIATDVTNDYYIDAPVTNGVTYHYVVTATNGTGESPQTADVSGAAQAASSILDNTAGSGVTTVGSWTASSATAGYYGSNYLHDGNTGTSGGKSVTYTPTLSVTGSYGILAQWPENVNRANNAPMDVYDGASTTQLSVNQRINGDVWNLLGTYELPAGSSAFLRIRNDGANGFVIADAVKFMLVLGQGPQITGQPVAIAVTAGNPAGFSVSATSSGTMSYQWFRDGVALTDGGSISGATTATLGISPASSGDAGTYSVVVTDNAGASSSVRALLTVN
jgi:hypothetical protein